MGYNHVEAFCIMTYQCNSCGSIEELWNSRDGVTPFIIRCPRCNGESNHINWRNDRPNENYLPWPGQRIFIDIPESIKKPLALRRIELFKNRGHDVSAEKAEEVVKSIVSGFVEGEPYIITWR